MSVAQILDILRKAKAGSRALDVRIFLEMTGGRRVGANCCWEQVVQRIDVPHYSTTVEGAMCTLPIDGYDWEFSLNSNGGYALAKDRFGLPASGMQSAPTMALAGCLAGFTIRAQFERQRRAA